MPRRNYSNAAKPQVLTAPVDTVAETLSVASTTGYPDPPFLLGLERGTANEEVALCTAKTATSFTVQRGYDGTTAQSHAVGAMVEHTVAAIDYREAGVARLTAAERNALSGDDLWEGRTIYNLDTDRLQMWDGSIWQTMTRESGADFTGTVRLRQIAEDVAATTAAATTTLDLSQGNTHTVTLNQNITLAFSNVPAGGSAVSVIFRQDATGGRTVTWRAGTKWPDGVPPVLGTGANAINIVTFLTPDGGTTWYGFLAGRNMA